MSFRVTVTLAALTLSLACGGRDEEERATPVAEESEASGPAQPRPIPAEFMRSEREACRADDFARCWEVGYSLAHGRGIEPAPLQAARYFARACRGEYADGCHELGAVLLRVVPPDSRGALEAFDRGCRFGNAEACAQVESMERSGAAEAAEEACDPE